MKIFSNILLLSILLFSSCKKDEKKHTVIYKIVVTQGSPAFSLSYSSDHNTTKTEGPITTSNWTSPKIADKKDKSSVFLTLQGGNGGSYKMYIYIDGYLEKEDQMSDPYGPRTIEAQIRD